jgi:hypothetical protein
MSNRSDMREGDEHRCMKIVDHVVGYCALKFICEWLPWKQGENITYLRAKFYVEMKGKTDEVVVSRQQSSDGAYLGYGKSIC